MSRTFHGINYHLFFSRSIFKFVLYFDAFNYIIKKQDISRQQFRKQHSKLSIISFIVSGYIASMILNGQFLKFPSTFDFNKFQNIILIYQIFLSSIAILITLNNTEKNKFKNRSTKK